MSNLLQYTYISPFGNNSSPVYILNSNTLIGNAKLQNNNVVITIDQNLSTIGLDLSIESVIFSYIAITISNYTKSNQISTAILTASVFTVNETKQIASDPSEYSLTLYDTINGIVGEIQIPDNLT